MGKEIGGRRWSFLVHDLDTQDLVTTQLLNYKTSKRCGTCNIDMSILCDILKFSWNIYDFFFKQAKLCICDSIFKGDTSDGANLAMSRT